VALKAVDVVPAAIVVNESSDSTVSIDDTLASLKPHVGNVLLHALRRDDVAGLERLMDALLRRN
jgi:hypothetical protein